MAKAGHKDRGRQSRAWRRPGIKTAAGKAIYNKEDMPRCFGGAAIL